MRSSFFKVPRLTLLILGVLAGIWVATAPEASAQRFQWPEEPKNLKVLPEDVKGARLGQVMRGFVSALGVRCEFCHMGEGPDLTQFDFESDEKPTKQKARVMIRMVQAINESHLEELTELGVAADQRVQVDCMICHRTQTKPVMLGDVLEAAIDSAGIDTAIARYHELREQYYGGFAYDFSSRTLTRLGDRLAGKEKFPEAIHILQLEIEMNGEQPRVLATLGNAQARAGDPEAAIRTFERGLELAPEGFKPFFQQQIDRLKNP